jgi:DNA-binding GntR family transcriptional regulator
MNWTNVCALWQEQRKRIHPEEGEKRVSLHSTKIDTVVQELCHHIRDGQYMAGQRLPAEPKLAEELQVSHQTLRTELAHF